MSRIIVILPTYNESENLPIVIPKLMELGLDGLKILIVDDDSPDGTGEIADELAKMYSGKVHILHRIGLPRGLGAAYADGFRYALKDRAEVIITMDADLSHDPHCIPTMVDLISQCDLVIGSRYTSGGSIDGNWGISRHILSHAAQWYIRSILGLRTKDNTSAFRCYRRSTLTQLNFGSMWSSGFGFLIELIYQAENLDLNIIETPIVFLDRTLGKSKVSTTVILEAMMQVAKIRLKRFQYRKTFYSRI